MHGNYHARQGFCNDTEWNRTDSPFRPRLAVRQHKQYQQMLKVKGLLAKYKPKGNCLHNAIAEKFFGPLKSELLYPKKFQSMQHFKQECMTIRIASITSALRQN